MSKRILITGAASGLGLALAQRYVAQGDQVLLTDRAEDFEPPAGSQYLQLDVTSLVDWQRAVESVERQFGGLDLLINNAGVGAGGRIDVVSDTEWRRVLDINVLGVVNGCRAFTPMLKRQGSGHIVNTASLAGLIHPPMMSSYNAAKAAVVALSEGLRYELGPVGIDVSVVCPAFFRTNLGSSFTSEDEATNHAGRRLIEKSKRSADDIARAVVRGIDKRQFLILPDRDARVAYWTKRFARPLYERRMRKTGERAVSSLARREAD